MNAILAAVLIRSLLAPDPDLITLVQVGDDRTRVHALLGPATEGFSIHGEFYWDDRYDEHTISYDSDFRVYDIDFKVKRNVPWPTVRR